MIGGFARLTVAMAVTTRPTFGVAVLKKMRAEPLSADERDRVRRLVDVARRIPLCRGLPHLQRASAWSAALDERAQEAAPERFRLGLAAVERDHLA